MFFLFLFLFCFFINNVNADYLGYNATSYNITFGNYISGNLTSLNEVDNKVLRIDEVVSSTGFVVEIDFNNTWDNTIDLSIRAFCLYEGNPAHDVFMELWNYTSSDWVTLCQINEGVLSWDNCSFPIRYDDCFVNNTVRARIIHESFGAVGHYLEIDYFKLWGYLDTSGLHWTIILIIGIISTIMVVTFAKK